MPKEPTPFERELAAFWLALGDDEGAHAQKLEMLNVVRLQQAEPVLQVKA